MTKTNYIRLKAGLYSFPRHTAQRYISDEGTYWVVTNTNNGEKVTLDNFKLCCEYINGLNQEATNAK